MHSENTHEIRRYEKASSAIWYETGVYRIEHALGITRRSVAVAHGINPTSSSWMSNKRKDNQHHHLCKSLPRKYIARAPPGASFDYQQPFCRFPMLTLLLFYPLFPHNLCLTHTPAHPHTTTTYEKTLLTMAATPSRMRLLAFCPLRRRFRLNEVAGPLACRRCAL